MRRISLVFLTVLMILCGAAFGSCSPSSEGAGSVLWYQEGLQGVDAKITFSDAEYKILIKLSEDTSSIEITEPENIKGVCILKEAGGAYVKSQGTKIPISGGVFSGVEPIFQAFELSEDNISQISAWDEGGNILTINSGGGVYTVFTDTGGSPVKIAFEGERTFEMSEIVLER